MAPTIIPTKQLPVTTSVGSPGSDTAIPTEQAVREAITAIIASAPVVASSTKLFLYGNCQ